MRQEAPERRDRESGSGLIMASFVLVLLAAMGTALLSLSETELKMSRSHMDAKRAYQFAESALEYARMDLLDTNGSDPFNDDLEKAGGGGVNPVIDFDPDNLVVTFDADGNATGISGFNDDVPLRPLMAFGNSNISGSFAAFLTNDPVEGESTVIDNNGRVMITAIGTGPRRSTEIVQAIIEPLDPIFDAPPAAITLLGPLPSFDNGTSAAQAHVGDDCGGSGQPGVFAPIVGTVDNAAKIQVQTDMNRPDKFHADSGAYEGIDTVADLTNPMDPILADSNLGTIDPGWTDCLSLKALVLQLIEYADFYCNTDLGACAIPAVVNPGDVIVIDGDATTNGNTTTTGILLVTGELNYLGNSQWNGAILAIGEGYLLRNGGGNGNPSGTVVVANIDPTPDGLRADKDDWCTTGSDGGFLQSVYETTGGGNATVEYCTQHLQAVDEPLTYKVMEFLQR